MTPAEQSSPLPSPIPTPPISQRVPWLIIVALLGVAIVTLGVFVSYLNTPAYSEEVVFTVNEGESAKIIADRLAEAGVVRSSLLVYATLVLRHDPTTIKASTYVFDTPLSTLEVAERITLGDFDTDLLRLTLIEGERAEQIARRAAAVLPDFDVASFTVAATAVEGRLFPETYFIPATFTHVELLSLLTDTYADKTAALVLDLEAHPLGTDGVITLASIVEREANDPTSMAMVAGILQNRLAIQMPLQADASIEYVLKTPLNELPPGELARLLETLDSPYNTYLNPGLPPTPIGNPGLDAITAVLNPTPSSYFYYITGDDGVFYYAETYDEHLDNIARHLRP